MSFCGDRKIVCSLWYFYPLNMEDTLPAAAPPDQETTPLLASLAAEAVGEESIGQSYSAATDEGDYEVEDWNDEDDDEEEEDAETDVANQSCFSRMYSSIKSACVVIADVESTYPRLMSTYATPFLLLCFPQTHPARRSMGFTSRLQPSRATVYPSKMDRSVVVCGTRHELCRGKINVQTAGRPSRSVSFICRRNGDGRTRDLVGNIHGGIRLCHSKNFLE